MTYVHGKRYLTLLMLVVTGILVSPISSHAEITRHFSIEGFAAFLDGNPETTGLTEEGGIILAPVTRDRLVQPEVSYSAAVAHGENIVVAQVDDGKVIAVDRAGVQKEIYKSSDSLVTSLLSHRDELYIATGPSAKIYRVSSAGEVKLFYEAEAEHIWAMVSGPNDTILCVTGGPGQLLQIDAFGNGNVLVETEQNHLRSIHYSTTYGVFVGGGQSGILYHGGPEDLSSLRALYDTGQKEITAIRVIGDHVYVAGVSGAAALVAQQGNLNSGPKNGKGPGVQSQVARVSMDGTSQVLAGSNDEVIFGMTVDSTGNVLVSTGATGREDPRGRIYSIDPNRRLISLLYQSPSRRITHLLDLPRGSIGAVASSGGRITHITGGFASEGHFVSAPFDLGINSKFGAVEVLGEFPEGTAAFVSLRTGQSARPDSTWSKWSAEVARDARKAPEARNGRYAQLRVRLQANSATTATPTVVRVRVAYLRKNLPPFVRQVSTLEKGVALLPLPRDITTPRTISLGDKSNKKKKNKSRLGKSAKARRVKKTGALTVHWSAEDPNDDVLTYELEVKRSGSQRWLPLDKELKHPFYTLSASQLPDGYYRFRVRASDAISNPIGRELEDEKESFSILVDNTAPAVSISKLDVTESLTQISFLAEDGVGPLTFAAFSLNGAPFRQILPDDGVLDGAKELFTLDFKSLGAGPHTVTVRVVDSSDNQGVGQGIFEVQPSIE